MVVNEETGVYLTIENVSAMKQFIKGAVKSGYLRKFDLREVATWIANVEYPVKIPVDINSVIAIGQNAVVKGIFGKNIENTITKYLKAAMASE